MGDRSAAEDLVPDRLSLKALQEAAAGCQACELHRKGTQTVFGDGSASPRIMFVGEQPGDQEDKQGEPFVGPAGRVLDQGLERAGIERSDTYITNVVKHFNWEPRGKRRIHQKPRATHIEACRPWLEAEVRYLSPEVIVALGATAAQALLGRSFRVTKQRGEVYATDLCEHVTATVHPSSILRASDDDARRAAMDAFVADLERVAEYLG